MAEEEKPKEEAKPAAKSPSGKKEKKGKRTRTGRKHENVDAYKFYKADGGKIERTKEHCPRCGEGTALAAHKGRKTCGRCQYTIFENRKA